MDGLLVFIRGEALPFASYLQFSKPLYDFFPFIMKSKIFYELASVYGTLWIYLTTQTFTLYIYFSSSPMTYIIIYCFTLISLFLSNIDFLNFFLCQIHFWPFSLHYQGIFLVC